MSTNEDLEEMETKNDSYNWNQKETVETCKTHKQRQFMKSDTLKIHIIKEEYRKADSNPPFNIHAIKVFLDATED